MKQCAHRHRLVLGVRVAINSGAIVLWLHTTMRCTGNESDVVSLEAQRNSNVLVRCKLSYMLQSKSVRRTASVRAVQLEKRVVLCVELSA